MASQVAYTNKYSNIHPSTYKFAPTLLQQKQSEILPTPINIQLPIPNTEIITQEKSSQTGAFPQLDK